VSDDFNVELGLVYGSGKVIDLICEIFLFVLDLQLMVGFPFSCIWFTLLRFGE